MYPSHVGQASLVEEVCIGLGVYTRLCFASEWLDQVVLLDGIPEGLSEDTRSDVVMVM